MNYEQITFRKLRNIISERTTPFIFWCGAGLSISAGFPSWSTLLQNIICQYRKEADEDDLSKLQDIERIEDLWASFTKLKDVLGNTDYSGVICHLFRW